MSDDLDLVFAAVEPEPDAPLVLVRYPVYVPDLVDGRYPARFMDNATLRVWLEFNEDWSLELLSPLPPVRHSVIHSIEEVGVDDFFSYHWRYDQPFFGRMDSGLEMGLCPRQPFYAELYASYYTSHTAEGDEYDCDMEFTVLEITPLSDLEIAKRISDCIQQ